MQLIINVRLCVFYLELLLLLAWLKMDVLQEVCLLRIVKHLMIVWHVDMPLVLRGLSLRPVLRVYWACVCLSVSVCMRTMSGRVILAEPSGNVSVSSPFVFFSLLHAHTHADSHMARHVNVTSFFNRSFYTHTLKNRCGWVQLSLPDESFLSLHPLISYFTRTHS